MNMENNFPTEKLMSQFRVEWEGPVITEKTFFEQQRNDPMYIGFPWATVVRLNLSHEVLIQEMSKWIDRTKEYYTCCQTIAYKTLIPLFEKLNIKCVYACHKTKDIDFISGIKINPCPLYAVSLEDPSRNKIFKTVDLLSHDRDYLYSFVGGYIKVVYLTDIRLRIFNLPKRDDIVVINTGEWHFNDKVYRNGQEDADKVKEYNRILLNSRYTLCPSGSGPNTIRLWEALGAGSIPILFIEDNLELPQHNLWEKAIIYISYNQLEELDSILSKITEDTENEMRKNCITIYNHFRNNYFNS
jgi:hypothetical protein